MPIELTLEPIAVAEDGGGSLVYTFTNDTPTAEPLTVEFEVGGTATLTEDFTVSSDSEFTLEATTGSITFPGLTVEAGFTVSSGVTSLFLDPAVLQAAGLESVDIQGTADPNTEGFSNPEQVAGFEFSEATDFTFEFSEGEGITSVEGTLEHTGSITFNDTVVFSDFTIGFNPARATDTTSGFFVQDNNLSDIVLFDLSVPDTVTFDGETLTIADTDLLISPEFANLAETIIGDDVPDLTGQDVGDARIDAEIEVSDDTQTVTLNLTPVADEVAEEDETVTLTLTPSEDVTIDTEEPVTATITNDDEGVEPPETEPITVTVTLENLAPENGTFLTPLWVGFHNGEFDLYDLGEPLNPDFDFFESLVEDGNNDSTSEAFVASGNGSIDATIPGTEGIDGPIDPGETIEFTFTLDPSDPNSSFFSYASMVIPSNDFFIANGNPEAHRIFDEEGNFLGADFTVLGTEVNDGGTEVNDEIPENTAFFGQETANTGVDENGVVTIAEDGFQEAGSGGILDSADFAEADFTVDGYEVARITVALADETPEPPTDIEDVALVATLSGEQEVQETPVVTDATGTSELTLNEAGDALEYSLTVTGLDFGAFIGDGTPLTEATDDDVTRVHLHNAPSGANGDIVFGLIDLVDPTFDGQDIDDLAITLNDDGSVTLTGIWEETDPASAPLSDFVADIQAGAGGEEIDLYWNIHTEEFPGGEIRGQLTVADEAPTPGDGALQLNQDNSFTLTEDDVNLQLTLNSVDAGAINEIGIFAVGEGEDEPTTEEILSNGEVIFSALTQPSVDFLLSRDFAVPSRILDDFDSGTKLCFYLVFDSTTDAVLAGQTPAENVILGDVDSLQVTPQDDGSFLVNFEDETDGDFNDLEVLLEVTTDAPQVGTDVQGEIELLDLTEFDGEVFTANINATEQNDFGNVGGLYAVLDEQGSIIDPLTGDTLTPGEEGYNDAALAQSVVEFTAINPEPVELAGGFFYAPYLTTDGDAEQFYSPFLETNADGLDHLILLGDNTFAFEDTLNLGNGDFNDFSFQVELEAVV